MGFLKDLDSVMHHFLWAGCLEASKWSLVSWEVVCSLKHYEGLGLRQSALTGEALALNFTGDGVMSRIRAGRWSFLRSIFRGFLLLIFPSTHLEGRVL